MLCESLAGCEYCYWRRPSSVLFSINSRHFHSLLILFNTGCECNPLIHRESSITNRRSLAAILISVLFSTSTTGVMSNETLDKIVAKLSQLDEYISYLRELQLAKKEESVSDHRLYGLAERYLHLSIEVLLDVGKALIIERSLRRPEQNAEIFSCATVRRSTEVAFTIGFKIA